MEDFVKLINLRVAREEWQVREHFSKDSTSRPNINRSGITLISKQNFRCTIPQSNNFMTVWTQRNAESASKTKISELEKTICINKQILRLQVTMKNAMTVAISKSIK